MALVVLMLGTSDGGNAARNRSEGLEMVSAVSPIVSGSFAATGQSATFTPFIRRPNVGYGFNISIYGTFVGSVQLERSFDGGSNWLPLTAAGTQLYKWTAPASEQAEETVDGTIYRLNCTAYTSGTINYRIDQ